jgi:hypothetical protein
MVLVAILAGNIRDLLSRLDIRHLEYWVCIVIKKSTDKCLNRLNSWLFQNRVSSAAFIFLILIANEWDTGLTTRSPAGRCSSHRTLKMLYAVLKASLLKKKTFLL